VATRVGWASLLVAAFLEVFDSAVALAYEHLPLRISGAKSIPLRFLAGTRFRVFVRSAILWLGNDQYVFSGVSAAPSGGSARAASGSGIFAFLACWAPGNVEDSPGAY